MSELDRIYKQVYKEVNLASDKVELLSSKSLKDFDKMNADLFKSWDSAISGVKKINDAVMIVESYAKSTRIKGQAYIDEANKLINDIKALGLDVPKSLLDGMEQARVKIDASTKLEKSASTAKGLF